MCRGILNLLPIFLIDECRQGIEISIGGCPFGRCVLMTDEQTGECINADRTVMKRSHLLSGWKKLFFFQK